MNQGRTDNVCVKKVGYLFKRLILEAGRISKLEAVNITRNTRQMTKNHITKIEREVKLCVRDGKPSHHASLIRAEFST